MPLAAITMAGSPLRARRAHVGLVVGVLVDGHQLVEGQRLAPGTHPGQGLFIPVGLQLPVDPGETPRQR